MSKSNLRIVSGALVGAIGSTFGLFQVASAQPKPQGSVTEFLGEYGELIASRDGIIYALSQDADLFEGDILRTKFDETTIIMFRGCEFELPGNKDVTLDDEFCDFAMVDDSDAMMAAADPASSNAIDGGLIVSGQSPLVVGGVVLAAGGLTTVATSNGGSGGSTASQSAGSNSPTPSSP